MTLSRSKITSQGQVRKKLGVGPGSTLEWEEEGDRIVVRRAGRFSSEDIHRTLFPQDAPEPRTIDDLKEGIRRNIRQRYARR